MCAAPALPCKNRLFVGEGNFSYTESLLEEHQDIGSLASFITATELCSFEELDDETKERIERLRNLGVTVLFEVDASALDRHFERQRFKRIHWNHPWDGNNYYERTLPRVIQQFFTSCRSMQSVKDRIHISILQPHPGEVWIYQQGYALDIVRGATINGYKLIKKRSMIRRESPRYRGYKTKHNRSSESISNIENGSKEFVFEKRPDGEVPSEYSLKTAVDFVLDQEKSIRVGSRTFYQRKTAQYYVCSTDDDSSNYYESENENASENSFSYSSDSSEQFNYKTINEEVD